jgi:hypothetical protein
MSFANWSFGRHDQRALRARATRLRWHARDTDVGTEHAVRTFAACTASVGPRGAGGVCSLGKFFKPRTSVRPGGLSAWRRVVSLGRGQERQVSRVQSRPERETERAAEHEQANNDGNPTQERHDILRSLKGPSSDFFRWDDSERGHTEAWNRKTEPPLCLRARFGWTARLPYLSPMGRGRFAPGDAKASFRANRVRGLGSNERPPDPLSVGEGAHLSRASL